MVIMCPILTAQVMREAFDNLILKETQERIDIVDGFKKNDERWMIPCRRDCGMWNQCHGIKMSGLEIGWKDKPE